MTRIYCNTFLHFNYKHVTGQRHFFCTMVHITVATKSMTHTVIYCSNTGIVGSTHREQTYVCEFLFLCRPVQRDILQRNYPLSKMANQICANKIQEPTQHARPGLYQSDRQNSCCIYTSRPTAANIMQQKYRFNGSTLKQVEW